MYKVSIIMPVYNTERYQRDSLDSIANQTIGVENLEVIIVDDASTDSSGEIIDEYCAKYSGFKAVHLEKNIGAATALYDSNRKCNENGFVGYDKMINPFLLN